MTVKQAEQALSDFDRGLLVGLLVGEGHFGGDGKQPQVTLRMHTDHEALFRWLLLLEARVVRRVSLPIGASVLVLARKPG